MKIDIEIGFTPIVKERVVSSSVGARILDYLVKIVPE